ncbi:unnamed protein product [Dicrocoelium dendriticum]|nr:unnamed protein product [Dicrocoelium dendriticum]
MVRPPTPRPIATASSATRPPLTRAQPPLFQSLPPLPSASATPDSRTPAPLRGPLRSPIPTLTCAPAPRVPLRTSPINPRPSSARRARIPPEFIRPAPPHDTRPRSGFSYNSILRHRPPAHPPCAADTAPTSIPSARRAVRTEARPGPPPTAALPTSRIAVRRPAAPVFSHRRLLLPFHCRSDSDRRRGAQGVHVWSSPPRPARSVGLSPTHRACAAGDCRRTLARADPPHSSLIPAREGAGPPRWAVIAPGLAPRLFVTFSTRCVTTRFAAFSSPPRAQAPAPRHRPERRSAPPPAPRSARQTRTAPPAGPAPVGATLTPPLRPRRLLCRWCRQFLQPPRESKSPYGHPCRSAPPP